MLSNFLRSLSLTIVLSFFAPIVLVAVLLATLSGIGCIPGFESAGEAGIAQLWEFLATFGTGCPVRGLMVIGCTCSLVGALFDTYAFYRYQSFNDR